MLRKWFEYGGRIILSKVTRYIKTLQRHEKEDDAYDSVWIDRELAHQRNFACAA